MEYYPRNPPTDPAKLPGFLMEELKRLQQALNAAQKAVRFVTLHAEPERYTESDVVIADGTDWNPGSGAGMYRRGTAGWIFIG